MKLSKELYDRETVLKAAYALIDSVYFHLDVDGDYYIVEIVPKKGKEHGDYYQKFENELISQQTRRIISDKTKEIRKMIVARALASTMVDLSSEPREASETFRAEDILIDWFDKNE